MYSFTTRAKIFYTLFAVFNAAISVLLILCTNMNIFYMSLGVLGIIATLYALIDIFSFRIYIGDATVCKASAFYKSGIRIEDIKKIEYIQRRKEKLVVICGPNSSIVVTSNIKGYQSLINEIVMLSPGEEKEDKTLL